MSADNSSKPVLETRNLSVRYGKVEALRGTSISLRAGEIVTVIGPNGAGKSSLLNAIMGALPSEGQAQGEVLYQGQDVSHHAIELRLGKGLALVPEKRELFTTMPVQDNLILGGYRAMKLRVPNWQREIERVYELFPRLKERRSQLAGTLSGGERQMLALGRALMSTPKLLMLDEPSLGLAPLVVRDIFSTIDRLRQQGMSILLVEQNARAALEVANHG